MNTLQVGLCWPCLTSRFSRGLVADTHTQAASRISKFPMTIQEPMPCVLLGHVCKLHAIVSVEHLKLCATVEITSGAQSCVKSFACFCQCLEDMP